MAEYYSKFTGIEIDNAVTAVNEATNKLYPEGSTFGNRLLLSKGAYTAINNATKIYRHTIDGEGFHCYIVTDCPYYATVSLEDTLSLFDQDFPYTIFRVGGTVIDGSSIIGITVGNDGYYGSNSLIMCLSPNGNIVFKNLTDQEFSGQLSYTVTPYTRKIN